MKQSLVINKKWILTASLLAVLATQYTFQNSSLDMKKSISLNNYKNAGEFVLASTVDDEAKHYAAEKKVEVEAATKLLTESGLTVTGTCKECETPATSTKAPTIEELLIKITTLEKTLETQSVKTTVATEVVVANESECEPARSDESRAERRERIQCEKSEKAEIKKQKLQDKIIARVEKFEDKMADLKEKCADDLECLTSGFTSALSRYEGSNALPKIVVSKEFKSVVGSALNKAMYSADADTVNATLASIQGLLQEMPDQYKELKQTVVDSVKTQTKIAADKVTSGYTQLTALSKANNPQAYFEAAEAIKAEHYGMSTLANAYSSSIIESIKTTEDSSMFSYYQKSYVPDMQKIMSSIGTAVTTTTTLDKTNNTRDSRSNTTTVANVVTSTEDNKMTLDKSTNAWLLPAEQSGVQSGAASSSSRGGRGPK